MRPDFPVHRPGSRLKAMPEFAEIPIIALTASAGPEAEKRCLDAGCTAHLAKPIQLKELFAVLQQHLRPGERGPNSNRAPQSGG